MTVYDSLSGKEIQSLPGPETMDGVHYDTNLKRIYMTGGRWYGTPEASPGWVYVYQSEGCRPLRSNLQDQDQASIGHFTVGTTVQSSLCCVSGNR
jgi:hypothetical protein